eukprot:TRINITY_DN11061_c0_g1_i1.p1 TRINITY_DN11061_c0_g1~~TRINITY_DN11061_c0_g1_i1.p1  ORF type:complete len:165 (-),score=34.09 TRINITY_DN11061_c0_g1_i1:23-517(-)
MSLTKHEEYLDQHPQHDGDPLLFFVRIKGCHVAISNLHTQSTIKDLDDVMMEETGQEVNHLVLDNEPLRVDRKMTLEDCGIRNGTYLSLVSQGKWKELMQQYRGDGVLLARDVWDHSTWTVPKVVNVSEDSIEDSSGEVEDMSVSVTSSESSPSEEGDRRKEGE